MAKGASSSKPHIATSDKHSFLKPLQSFVVFVDTTSYRGSYKALDEEKNTIIVITLIAGLVISVHKHGLWGHYSSRSLTDS